jgi:hypothetical protein
MKRMYIKAVCEIENEPENNYIGDLILFDLDLNKLYFIRNENANLENNYHSFYKESNYINNSLKDSFEISEDFFNDCLKMKMNRIYRLDKNDFLINCGIFERAI